MDIFLQLVVLIKRYSIKLFVNKTEIPKNMSGRRLPWKQTVYTPGIILFGEIVYICRRELYTVQDTITHGVNYTKIIHIYIRARIYCIINHVVLYEKWYSWDVIIYIICLGCDPYHPWVPVSVYLKNYFLWKKRYDYEKNVRDSSRRRLMQILTRWVKIVLMRRVKYIR